MSISKSKLTPDTLEQFKRVHERRAEQLEERQEMTVKGDVGWAKDKKNIGKCDGRVGKLLKKLKEGKLKPAAFKEAIKVMKDPTRRRKDEYKNLFDHLINGDFLNFGENFPTILGALESEDKDVQELTEKFTGQNLTKEITDKKSKDIQSEASFLKDLSKLRKSKLTPDEIMKQARATVELTRTEEGGGTVAGAVKEMITNRPSFGIVPAPNVDQKEFAETTRQMTEFLAQSTQKLDELSAAIKESQTLAEARDALKQKIEKDPSYVKELIGKLLLDHTLLKRSAKVLAKVDKNPELKEALRDFDDQRRSYWRGNKIGTPEAGETPHTQFMKMEASKSAREALEKAAMQSKDRLLEATLELEIEGAVDEVAVDAAESKTKVDEKGINRAIESTIKKKYGLETVTVDLETLKKARSLAEEFVDHQQQNADTKSSFIQQCADLRNWEDEAMDIADDAELLTTITGLNLFEQKNGKIIPRDTEIAYKQDGETKTAKVTKVEYKPLEVDPEDREEYEDKERWRAKLPQKGEMHITFEIDGRELTKDFRNFFGWVSRVDAYERISKQELEERIGAKVEKGTMFFDDIVSDKERDKPHYNVIEIEEVSASGVKLQRPAMYRSRFEVYPQTITKKDEFKDELTFGEFYSLFVRRDMSPMDDSAIEKAGVTKEPKWFRREYGAGGFAGKGGTEEIRLNEDGTLGDTLKKFGSGIFGKEVLTDAQKQAFEKHPTFAERFFDRRTGKHFVKDHTPSARLIKYAGKNALAELMEPQEDEPPNPELTEGEHEEIAEQTHEEEHKGDAKHKEGRHIHEEALPIEQTHMFGESHTTHRGYLSELWKNTKFLATDDVWGLMKACYEHYERRWQRRSKEKFATVGEGLPWGYGTEMGRVKQSAENEEVQQYTDAMEEWGVWDIVEELRHAKNKDQLKACFKVLSHHGHVRWDDVEMWECLNRFIPQHLQVPIPPNHNAYAIDPRTRKTGFDYIEDALDYLWGEGAYQNFFSENNSNYDSKLKRYQEKGKQTEGDVKNNGSVVGELANLLTRHKSGEYVDPHEYEGLIHFMIDAGKGTMEAKIYYMIEGVTIKSPVTGETILGLDRLGSINGVYLNRLPFMDYLTRKDVPRPESGGETTSWTLADFQKWCNQWEASADKSERPNMPPPGVTKFIWEHVLPDEKTQIRNNKGLRNPENIDHDDAHFIVPLADEKLITNVCQSISGGKRAFTTEGYANAYPGYNQWVKSLAQRGEKSKLVNAIKAFTRFNAILETRYKKENEEGFARLDDSFFHRPSVVDTRPTGWHKTQMEEVTKAVARAYAEKYGETDLLNTVETLHKKTGSMADKNQAQEQKKVQAALDTFGEKLKTAVEKDKAELLIQVINNFNLSGMEIITEEEKIRRKGMFKQSDLDKVFTDWQSDS